jgi:hypothetical protein
MQLCERTKTSVITGIEDRMETYYPSELIGGEIVSPLVVREKQIISDSRKGTAYVESGKLIIEGSHDGALNVLEGASAEIRGKQYGVVNIGSRASVTVNGMIEGIVNIEKGGVLKVEEGGKLSGNVFNNGIFYLRGTFGGFSNGEGEIKVEGAGHIKKPVVKDGLLYFEW